MTRAELDAALEVRHDKRRERMKDRARKIREYEQNHFARLRHAELIARDG